jgi:hypothetical protein
VEIGDAVTWAQNQSNGIKFAFSCLVWLVAALLCFVIWQKPPPKESAPGSNTQSGNVASTGQSGGVTAGQFIFQAPPVTDQQKKEQLSSLESTLSQLATFPNRPYNSEPRTIMQQIYKNQLPLRLFSVLNGYYVDTIKSVPEEGHDLFEFQKSYDDFENREYVLETDTITEIGKLVSVRFSQAWSIYLRYIMFRVAGLSQKNIIDGGSFLNYGITWDDAEKVFSQINESEAGGAQKFSSNFLQQRQLAAKASTLIARYVRP